MLDVTTKTTGDRVMALVEGLLAANGGPGRVGARERLVDAGLTSMDMVNLMLAVEAEFDILIPPGDITPANFRSVASIEAMVDRVAAADAD